jgi:hypothetical protein
MRLLSWARLVGRLLLLLVSPPSFERAPVS